MLTLLFRFLFACVAILSSSKLFANETLEAKQVDGVPHNQINDIYQDRRGFVWIATLDGLFRYDGLSYTSYQINQTSNTISSNMIRAIAEDSKGNIWVGTFGRGVSKIEPKSGNITNYSLLDMVDDERLVSDDAMVLIVDHNDNIWVGNSCGVVKILADSDKAIFYTLEHNRAINVVGIFEDRNNNMWISDNHHTYRVISDGDGELISESFEVGAVDICNFDGGGILVSNNKAVYHIAYRGGKYTLRGAIIEKKAWRIACDNSNIWVGSDDGVTLYKSDGESWTESQRFNKDNVPFLLETNSVFSLMQSRSGQLWVGTNGSGIFMVSKRLKNFRNHPEYTSSRNPLSIGIVKSIFSDSRGDLWLGTNYNGYYFLHRKRGKSLDLQQVERFDADGRSCIFAETQLDGDNIIWIGGSFRKPLISVNQRTKQIIPQSYDLSKMMLVDAIAVGADNTLWVGTYQSGLWRLKLNERGEIIDHDQFKCDGSGDGLISNVIRSLFIDDADNLWIGTDMGVNRLGRDLITSDNPQFESYFEGVYALQINQFRDKTLAVGTMGSGMILYNIAKDHTKYITTDMGLANNAVKTIYQEVDGAYVWIATNRGISKYDPLSGVITNYNMDDGLSDDEFSEICGDRLQGGEIIFGHRRGVTIFNPQEIKRNEVTPTPYFTDLYINSQKVAGVDLSFTSHLVLDYDERNFAIGFVGINFTSAHNSQYTYKLEGVDDDWREVVGSEPIAHYTNIHEGQYRLLVRVANGDGVLSDEALSMDIVVHPPYYRTWLAYLIYLVILLIITAVVVRFVLLMVRHRQDLKMAKLDQHRAEELATYKLEYFTTISAEFDKLASMLNIELDNEGGESKNLTPADMKFISNIIEIITKNIENPEMNAESIARDYGVSRAYLNRKIKSITGETTTRLLRSIRMNHAAKLLVEKRGNVSEIGVRVGYSDTNLFRVRFKEMFGVSPSQYKGTDPIEGVKS